MEPSTCLTMTIAGNIHLKGLSPELVDVIKKKLELPNLDYQQAIKRNPRARYHLSPVIKYYEAKTSACETGTSELVAPRGILEELRHEFKQRGVRFEEVDERVLRPARIETSIKLRPYQLGADARIAGSECGIVRADTGYGKTVIALRVIQKIGQRTLIIVPTINLLNQFTYAVKQFTGRDAGIIQGTNFDIQDITVATWQTVSKRISEGRLTGKEFGCTMVDECHGSVTPKRRRTLARLRSRFLYGLTATARRTDGQGEAIKWLFGPIIFDGKIERAQPTVEVVPFTGKIWVQEYADMIAEQVENEERNQLIVNIVRREIDAGRKVLVLTKRIKHYELLQEAIDRERVLTIKAGDKTNLTKFRDDPNSFTCLLGTFNLLGTGVDIPSLDTLVIAGDLKSDVLAEQSAGRILRLLGGKKDPRIIDIQDKGNGILRNHARLREVFYRENGWRVMGG